MNKRDELPLASAPPGDEHVPDSQAKTLEEWRREAPLTRRKGKTMTADLNFGTCVDCGLQIDLRADPDAHAHACPRTRQRELRDEAKSELERETDAIRECVGILLDLDEGQRKRLLAYLVDRFGGVVESDAARDKRFRALLMAR